MAVLRRVDPTGEHSTRLATSTVVGMVLGVCEYFSLVLLLNTNFNAYFRPSKPLCYGRGLPVYPEEEKDQIASPRCARTTTTSPSSAPYTHPHTMHHIPFLSVA